MQPVKAATVYDFISNNHTAIMLRKKEKPITIVCKLSDTKRTLILNEYFVFKVACLYNKKKYILHKINLIIYMKM